MNGIHDMGGMDGMGPIAPERDEPVFHETWEGRVYAISRRIAPWGQGRNWRSFRFEIESIPAAEYLRMPYYERWFTMIINRLLTSNLITAEELRRGRTDPNSPRPQLLPESPAAAAGAARLEVEVSPRFRPQQRVRARNLHPRGHTRLPRYVRGKVGTVTRDHGVFALQDTDENGQRLGQRPQHVYAVRFVATELWGDRGSANESVYLDLWDDYLEPA